MIIKGIEFKSKKQEIDYLMQNKKELIELKKSAIKFADAPNMAVIGAGATGVVKGLSTSKEHDTDVSIQRTVIGNTYNYLDSHGDVHLSSTFTKSLQERGDRVKHLHDHLFQVTAKVGQPLNVYEQSVAWKDLGINKAGTTVALMMDSNILKEYNSLVFNEYKSGNIDQHSVGMYYVKVDIAANDDDYPEAQKLYLAHIDKIGNREEVEERGYFWAVQEAKLVEISAVLEGSNPITHTVEAKDVVDEPVVDKAKEAAENEAKKKAMLLKHLQ
jgi:hypothetical protein